VSYAARFPSAAAALAFAAGCAATGAPATGYCLDAAGHWWVRAELTLHIGRELALAVDGQGYVEVEDGALLRDTGWGPPPGDRRAPGTVPARTLTPSTLLELVRAAGLIPVDPPPMSEAHLLAPGALVRPAVRRALELELTTGHRVVRLRPMFPAGADGDADAGMTFEVVLRAPAGQIPPSYLAALADYPLSAVCRPVGDGRIVIQHGLASPLTDRQLLALFPEGRWALCDALYGSWRIEQLAAELTDSGTLVEISARHPLDRQRLAEADPALDTAVDREAVRLIPARYAGRRVDACLLDTDDLETLALLLEGHPLADTATVVPGRDRHLLLAPGGVHDRVPIGLLLTCIGPKLLYIPVGQRLTPSLPRVARETLFGVDDDHAVVVLPDRRLVFDLTARQPAWLLWAADPPAVDSDLPAESLAALRSLAEAEAGIPPPKPPPPKRTLVDRLRGRRAAPAPPRRWQDEAFDAERVGDLIRAAELHEQHNEHFKAGLLWERAAEERRTT
jgi:hypothetical protein